eukprot:2685229-Pyramimonas_sp.AAC.2
MSKSAVVSTLAGTGVEGYQDGEGNAAKFVSYPYGVAVDGDGNVIVGGIFNDRIRKVSPQGLVSTLAGTGKAGYQDGDGTAAQFNKPCGVVLVHRDNSVIVADVENHRIRRISPQGL